MSLATLVPDSVRQRLEWRTNVLIARDGTEQRIALRANPRQYFTYDMLADHHEEIQWWKYEFAVKLDNNWNVPIWVEAVKTTSAVTGGASIAVNADFSLMNNDYGVQMMLFHPDGETFEIFNISVRSDTTATLATGNFVNSYPVGSWIMPVEACLVDNGVGYSPLKFNAARVGVDFLVSAYRSIEGKGAPALTTYNSKNVLDRVPLDVGGKEAYQQQLSRIDYGGVVQVDSEQVIANIVRPTSYLSDTALDRQWWKAFLLACVGQQKSFYAPTNREDLTVVNQPSTGGSTFDVEEDGRVAGGWEFSASHLHLAIETADGATQYKEIDPATTFDNGDGTHQVGLTSGLTATIPGSTIVKISFLELVRLASDTVEIEHAPTHRIVSLSLRTIQG